MNITEQKLEVYNELGDNDFVICDVIATFTILDWEYSETGYLVSHNGKKRAVVLEYGIGKMIFISLEELQELVVTYKAAIASTESILEQLTND